MTLRWYKVTAEYYVPADTPYQAIIAAKITSMHRNPDVIVDVRLADTPDPDLTRDNKLWYCPDCGVFFGEKNPLVCPGCGAGVKNTTWFIDHGYDPEKGTLKEQVKEYFGSMKVVKDGL